MTQILRISSRYRKAVFEAVGLQVLIGFLSLLFLDGGDIARICGIVLLGFWGGAVVLLCRRPRTPTRTDIEFIRFGYLLILLGAYFLVPYIWSLRDAWWR
jgi:hypothetical protein